MAGKNPGQRHNAPSYAVPILGLLLGAVGMVILAVSVGIFVLIRLRQPPDVPPALLVENPPVPAPIVAPPQPPPPIPMPPPQPVNETWWEKDSILNLTVYQLQGAFPQDEALFKSLGTKTEIMRWEAYKNLAAKLPEFLRKDSAKRQLARLLSECYALEPVEGNLLPVREWLIRQIPRQDKEYPPGFKTADLDNTFWALDVCLEALTHKSVRLDRVKSLSHDLGQALGFAIDPSLPRGELKAQAEKLLAMRCYRNLAPTAAKSLHDALAIRGPLLLKISQHLSPSFREKADLELAFVGLPKAKSAWTGYSELLTDCLKNEDVLSGVAVVQLYEQADPDLAAKMDALLASKWKSAADDKLDQRAKVKAFRRALGLPDPTDRLTVLEKLSRETLAGVKAPAHQSLAILQETARLTHVSTMACALLQKEIGLGRFDYLVANVPELDMPETKAPDSKDTIVKKTSDKVNAPKGDPAPAKGKWVSLKPGEHTLRDEFALGVGKKIYPITLSGGKTYDISMESPFGNSLQLLNSQGQQMTRDDGAGLMNTHIQLTAPYNDGYRLVVASVGKTGVGPYMVTVQERPGFAGPGGFPFGPKRKFMYEMFVQKFGAPPPFPGPPPQPPVVMAPGKNPAANPEKAKTPAPPPPEPLVEDADLNNLAANVAKIRVTALQNISSKLKGDLLEKDLTTRQAVKIAKYLVAISDSHEVEQALPNLAPLAKSRNFLLALADNIEFDKAIQKTNEAVVGTLAEQTLHFGRSDTWRISCRKLLIQQALDLVSDKKGTATDAADLLRDYYREQAGLLGVPAAELAPLTKPSQVMAVLIKHVAGDLAKKNPAKADKEQLEQAPRMVAAAQFVAQDDLELTAMLQRVWLKVLAVRLEQATPARGMDMRRLSTELSESDPLAVNVLEQLRAGEDKILRLWGMGLDLK